MDFGFGGIILALLLLALSWIVYIFRRNNFRSLESEVSPRGYSAADLWQFALESTSREQDRSLLASEIENIPAKELHHPTLGNMCSASALINKAMHPHAMDVFIRLREMLSWMQFFAWVSLFFSSLASYTNGSNSILLYAVASFLITGLIQALLSYMQVLADRQYLSRFWNLQQLNESPSASNLIFLGTILEIMLQANPIFCRCRDILSFLGIKLPSKA